MKVRQVRKLTKREKEAVIPEIRRQCLAEVKNYEVLMDSVVLATLHNDFGFGKDRLERFYKAMNENREDARKRFQEDTDIIEYSMFYYLKNEGIDVQKMHDEYESRIKIEMK